MKIIKVLKNEFRDSLYLLRMSGEISEWEGVIQSVIVSGTENNKRILDQVNLLTDEIRTASPDDLVIAIEVDEKTDSKAILERLIKRLEEPMVAEKSYVTYNKLEEALSINSNASLVLISTPGEYAFDIAKTSLENGKHVFCFSHHMSVEDELTLKQLASEKYLLMMGPDCGTSIIDGYGLGFANVVRHGPIGLVSASGSGLQEVTCLIHRAGSGISQAIGVGGRDLLKPINGLMARGAIKILARDPETQVIVVLAKAADVEVQELILQELKTTNKSFVIDFASTDHSLKEVDKDHIADTFEECSAKAVRLAGKSWTFEFDLDEYSKKYESIVQNLNHDQALLWGLYSGGSLAGEARRILKMEGIETFDTFALDAKQQPNQHLIIDLGAEEFTEGRAHPFIDTRLRKLIIEKAFADQRIAVILLDVVLGWGSHKNPAGEIVSAIQEAKRKYGRGPVIVAYVCGTPEDPQGLESQKAKLIENGVIVPETNVQAAKIAGLIINEKTMGEK